MATASVDISSCFSLGVLAVRLVLAPFAAFESGKRL